MASAAPRYLLVEAHGDWLLGEKSPNAQHNQGIYIIGLTGQSSLVCGDVFRRRTLVRRGPLIGRRGRSALGCCLLDCSRSVRFKVERQLPGVSTGSQRPIADVRSYRR